MMKNYYDDQELIFEEINSIQTKFLFNIVVTKETDK